MNKIGIIGYGEIGESLEKCYLGKKFQIGVLDIGKNIDTITENIDILNICIPYTDRFVDIVSSYITKYAPKVTIIHSTIVPETTRKIIALTGNKNVVHSPVRGVHPKLYEGLKTFTKFVGGEDIEAVQLTTEHYEVLEISYEVVENSVASELAKILCTTYYGVCIAFHYDILKLCEKYNVNYDEVATKWNSSYNEGYIKLGMGNVVRPVLYPPKDGKIGGHCVVPNAELCKTFFESEALDYILKLKK
jgi:UDP-N-acetyl-D-mannosaminuronate dehydrogenase